MRDFSQRLYTFSLKLKLYLSDRSSNHMSSQHDHVVNLDHQSWSWSHVIINIDHSDFSCQYWSFWLLLSILIANLDHEIMWCQTNLSWYWDSWQVFHQVIISANEISFITIFNLLKIMNIEILTSKRSFYEMMNVLWSMTQTESDNECSVHLLQNEIKKWFNHTTKTRINQ